MDGDPARMLQQGPLRIQILLFCFALIFWRVALPVAGEKSRLDTDSWISDSWILVFWVFFFFFSIRYLEIVAIISPPRLP